MNLFAGGPAEEVKEIAGTPLKILKSYDGVCHVSSEGLQQNSIITSNSEYYSFIKTIPRYEIGMGDMPKSKDPLLKKPRINFKKNMMIVIVNPDFFKYTGLKFINVIKTGDDAVINYILKERTEAYNMQWPYGVSYYEAIVVEKIKGKIEFRKN